MKDMSVRNVLVCNMAKFDQYYRLIAEGMLLETQKAFHFPMVFNSISIIGEFFSGNCGPSILEWAVRNENGGILSSAQSSFGTFEDYAFFNVTLPQVSFPCEGVYFVDWRPVVSHQGNEWRRSGRNINVKLASEDERKEFSIVTSMEFAKEMEVQRRRIIDKLLLERGG